MAAVRKAHETKVHINVLCSPEERKLIKLLATLSEQTISDFLISLAKDKKSQISQDKEPTTDSASNFNEEYWIKLGFSA